MQIHSVSYMREWMRVHAARERNDGVENQSTFVTYKSINMCTNVCEPAFEHTQSNIVNVIITFEMRHKRTFYHFMHARTYAHNTCSPTQTSSRLLFIAYSKCIITVWSDNSSHHKLELVRNGTQPTICSVLTKKIYRSFIANFRLWFQSFSDFL